MIILSSSQQLCRIPPSQLTALSTLKARYESRTSIRRSILLCSVHASYVQNHSPSQLPVARPASEDHGPATSVHIQWKRQTSEISDSVYASSCICITFGRSIDIIRSGFSASRSSCRRRRPLSGNFFFVVSTQSKACNCGPMMTAGYVSGYGNGTGAAHTG